MKTKKLCAREAKAVVEEAEVAPAATKKRGAKKAVSKTTGKMVDAAEIEAMIKGLNIEAAAEEEERKAAAVEEKREKKKQKKQKTAPAATVAPDDDAEAVLNVLRKAKKKKAAAGEAPPPKRKLKVSPEALPPPAVRVDGEASATATASAANGSAGEERRPDHLHPFKVFVNGLPWKIERATVEEAFKACGEIERLDMPRNSVGKPTGTSFIYFEAEEGVQAALKLDGKVFHGRAIKVMRARRQKTEEDEAEKDGEADNDGERAPKARGEDMTVIVGNLPKETREKALLREFGACGEIETMRAIKDSEGVFKGTVFIVYKHVDSAKEALEKNGTEFGGKTIKVRLPRLAGLATKGKGKGKGARKTKKDGRKRICHAFTEGTCTWGPSCRYIHA